MSTTTATPTGIQTATLDRLLVKLEEHKKDAEAFFGYARTDFRARNRRGASDSAKSARTVFNRAEGEAQKLWPVMNAEQRELAMILIREIQVFANGAIGFANAIH